MMVANSKQIKIAQRYAQALGENPNNVPLNKIM